MNEAFDLLHRELQPDVERFVRARIAEKTRRQDVCQEVWVAVREGLPRFAWKSKPRTWLLSIAYHKLTRAYGTTSFATLDSVAEAAALPIFARPPTPTEKLDAAVRARALHRALAGLTAEERELLELRFVVDLKPAEIVEVLGIDASPNGISQRIVRLVRRLAKELTSLAP